MKHFDKGPSAAFIGDHRECDDLWAAVEQAVSSGDQGTALAAWADFSGRMRRHFGMEEDILFPAIEDATGMRGGPTAVMRHEHAQMRGLLDQMEAAAGAGRLQALLDDGDTLLMIIQQHNTKEEGILYPLADQVLQAQWPELVERLKSR